MRFRRAVAALLVFVLLGTVATVLSSWAIHGVQFWRLHQGSRMAYGWTRVELSRSLLWRGSDAATIEALGPWRALPDDPKWRSHTSWQCNPTIRRRFAGWLVESHDFSITDPAGRTYFVSREALCILDSGFPVRSMRCGAHVGDFFDTGWTSHTTRSDGSSLRHGLQLTSWTQGPPRPIRSSSGRTAPLDRFALPLLPLWPGFAINTAFYALLLFIAWRLPGALRRAVRRRGGRCVRCGYDRGGLNVGTACPECGAGTGRGPRVPAVAG